MTGSCDPKLSTHPGDKSTSSKSSSEKQSHNSQTQDANSQAGAGGFTVYCVLHCLLLLIQLLLVSVLYFSKQSLFCPKGPAVH